MQKHSSSLATTKNKKAGGNFHWQIKTRDGPDLGFENGGCQFFGKVKFFKNLKSFYNILHDQPAGFPAFTHHKQDIKWVCISIFVKTKLDL